MKLFSSILLCLIASISAAQQIYESKSFVLHLKGDSSFIYYPKEVSMKTLIAGDYLLRKDSLILTTHRHNGETAILAIYDVQELEINLLYTQEEFIMSISDDLYIQKDLYADNKVKNEYYWNDYSNKNYSLYTFSPEGYFKSIEFYEHHKLEGKQLYFYTNRGNNLQMEASYQKGEMHGKQYYYEPLNEDDGKMALVKKEKYKKGVLMKSKKLATPPIFYTNHF